MHALSQNPSSLVLCPHKILGFIQKWHGRLAILYPTSFSTPTRLEAVPLWLATKHKYPAGQACGILESRRLALRIVRASRLVKELATKYPLNR